MTTQAKTNEVPLTMSAKERERLKVIGRVVKHELSCAEAAESLRLTKRQLYRIRDRYLAEGDEGLVHRLRGATSNRGFGYKVRMRVLSLYRERYSDYGPKLFTEMIAQYHSSLVVVLPDHETIRRWLLKAGLWTTKREVRKHRRRRERRAAQGSLIQIDASEHEWFEKRGPKCALLVMIDDASGTVYARFATSENTRDILSLLRGYIEQYGIPCETYTDRAGVYRNLTGVVPTDVERALGRLGVHMITAHSPQAKGRVERCNRTLQDRLVKALRREGIGTIEQANRYLERTFLEDHNMRFAHIKGLKNVHRPAEGIDLDNIFCFETTRKVNNDYTITLGATIIQLEASKESSRPVPRSSVTVRRWLKDDEIRIYWNEEQVNFIQLTSKPKSKGRTGRQPAIDHPWRNLMPIGRGRYKSAKPLKSHNEREKVVSSTPARK